MTKVLHLEKASRVRARDPGPVAAPAPCTGQRVELLVQPLEAMLRQAVNSEVKHSLHSGTKPTGSTWGSDRSASACHGLLLPRRSVDVDGKAIQSGAKQELASARGLEKRALALAEVKHALQLRRFTRPLSAEEDKGGIGRHHRPRIRA